MNKDFEDQLIQKKLGRQPTSIEKALFSALWSEHCSYKSSKIHLKKLFRSSSRVVSAEGENAGVIDLGQDEKVAFKMESHNHPSFIEPYEGAATGVGGILRDIFTMGARPIMLANYLCFGRPEAPRMKGLIDGVVRGIAGYGNCVGVPMVTGQTEFDRSYDKNILVNALAVGLFRPGENIVSSIAKGPGNLVVYVGAKTGKDGIHGAAMSSAAFDDDSESKKPTIQKGDPFYEKLLIESCLEVMHRGLVIAIQDMGAAGLTSSSFEMAAKGQVGLRLELDKVPLRDRSMTPEEILLSESQERMLLICEPHQFPAIQETFSRWSLDAEVIGEVLPREGDRFFVELFWQNERVCKIDPRILVDEAPIYERPFEKWMFPNKKSEDSSAPLAVPSVAATLPTIEESLLSLLSDARASSREWIYRQFDQRVGGRTASDCQNPIGVVQLPDSKRALGLALGCRPYVMRMDAALGGADAVAYPALELASKGFETLAMTDCLNFGNPENIKIMSEFVASLSALSEQAQALQAPIISGNVSFYNETLGQNITSTPSTGLIGIRPSCESLPKSFFDQENSEIFCLELPLLRTPGRWSEIQNQPLPWVGSYDSIRVKKFIDLVLKLSQGEGVQATRVVGQFGLLYTLVRMTLEKSIGCELMLDEEKAKKAICFEETFYQVLFVIDSSQRESWLQLFKTLSKDEFVTVTSCGVTRSHNFSLSTPYKKIFEIEVNKLKIAYSPRKDIPFEFMA